MGRAQCFSWYFERTLATGGGGGGGRRGFFLLEITVGAYSKSSSFAKLDDLVVRDGYLRRDWSERIETSACCRGEVVHVGSRVVEMVVDEELLGRQYVTGLEKAGGKLRYRGA